MVEHESARLDAVFRALADPTRRGMIRELSRGPRSVGELAGPLVMSFAGASKHVKVLEDAGLIRREIRGRTHLCRLEPSALSAAEDWISRYTRFWTERLDALERELETDEARREVEQPRRRRELRRSDERGADR